MNAQAFFIHTTNRLYYHIRGIKKAPTVSDDSESPLTYQLKIRIKKELIVIIRLAKMEVDNMTVASQVKQTLASLKGARGTLSMYTMQTRDDETQSVYTNSLEIADNIINDLEDRLKALEFEEPQYKGN